MRPRLIVLRPEPGNAATCERIRAQGGDPVALPLFRVRPIAWTPPDTAAFDSLLLTSANAVRHAGPALAAYAHLPAIAVGQATARAAEARGLHVVATGSGDASDAARLLAERGLSASLHLTGREHRHAVGVAVPVYASEALEIPTASLVTLKNGVALLHSPRAALRLGQLIDGAGIDRADVAIAAISANAAAFAGSGWRKIAIPPSTGDAPLVATALSIDRNRPGGDKTP